MHTDELVSRFLSSAGGACCSQVDFFSLSSRCILYAGILLPANFQTLFSSHLQALRERLMTPACCTCSALHMQKHAETVECTVLSKVGKRLSLARNPLQSIITRAGPPTPCASPELMKHSNASDFPQTQCPKPGEVYLATFTHRNCIGSASVRAVPFSIVRKDLQNLGCFLQVNFLGTISWVNCHGNLLWAVPHRRIFSRGT